MVTSRTCNTAAHYRLACMTQETRRKSTWLWTQVLNVVEHDSRAIFSEKTPLSTLYSRSRIRCLL